MLIFQSLDSDRMLIWQKKILWKSAIYHLIKLPFDAEVDEKFLSVIYCKPRKSVPVKLPLHSSRLWRHWKLRTDGRSKILVGGSKGQEITEGKYSVLNSSKKPTFFPLISALMSKEIFKACNVLPFSCTHLALSIGV